MNDKYMELHFLADGYLQGSLSDRETAEFEERLVWDQEAMDEVELAEKLRDGLRVVVDKSSALAEPSVWQRAASLLYSPTYAAAASVLLAVSLAFNVWPLRTDAPGADGSIEAAMTPQIIAPLGVRSTTPQTVEIDQNRWAVLLVDVLDRYTVYRVAIVSGRDSGSQPLWQQADMRATYPEALAVGLPGNALAPGTYTLRLEGLTTPDEGSNDYELVTEIPFRTITAP